MKGVEASLAGVERRSQLAGLQTGRLGSQFANLATQIAHVHPIAGNLASVLGNFAYGSLMSAGILGGLAAIAVAYDLITSSARKAKKETDAFIKSLVDETKAAYNASFAGRQLAADRAQMELEAAKRASGVGVRSVIGSILTGSPMMAGADMAASAKRVADATSAVAQANSKLAKAWEDSQPPLVKVKGHVDSIKRAVEEIAFSWKDALMAVYAMDNTLEKMTLRDAVAALGPAAIDPNLDPRFANRGLRDFGTTISGVDTDIGLTKEQIKTRDALIGNADKNTGLMTFAITQSAQIIASTVSQALNIGGGGRGSSIGGMIGAVVGGAAGSLLGPPGAIITSALGGALGSVIGGLAGSLFGGLFDRNKKATNENTSAIRALTQAMMMNAPSGFKVGGYRNAAADAVYQGPRNPASGAIIVNGDIYGVTNLDDLAHRLRTRSARGGAPILTAA